MKETYQVYPTESVLICFAFQLSVATLDSGSKTTK